MNQKNSHIEFLENQLQKYKSNEDKKNELILTNNDVIKNNQEMEKINENREDKWLKRIDEKLEEAKNNYKDKTKSDADKLKIMLNILIDNNVKLNKNIVNNIIDSTFRFEQGDE